MTTPGTQKQKGQKPYPILRHVPILSHIGECPPPPGHVISLEFLPFCGETSDPVVMKCWLFSQAIHVSMGSRTSIIQ